MMSSIPVAFSSVRMFLPSLPMMRAFISSLGRGTTDTVISEACSVEHFWIARLMISFALRPASSFASASMFRTSPTASLRASSSIAETNSRFASSLLI